MNRQLLLPLSLSSLLLLLLALLTLENYLPLGAAHLPGLGILPPITLFQARSSLTMDPPAKKKRRTRRAKLGKSDRGGNRKRQAPGPVVPPSVVVNNPPIVEEDPMELREKNKTKIYKIKTKNNQLQYQDRKVAKITDQR